MPLESLPVLDYSQLAAGPEQAARFRDDLRRAMHEVGFIYLSGHGIPQELTNTLLEVSLRFFALPEEQKLAIENVDSPQFRGYTRVGGELTAGAVDWREQLDFAVERETQDPRPGGPDYWRLEGPNLGRSNCPECRTSLPGGWGN